MRKMNASIFLLVFLLSCLSLTSCGSYETSSIEEENNEDKLVIWAWDENYNVLALQMAVEIFNLNHPDAEVDIISMSQEETVAKLNSALVTNSKDSLPDIVLIEDYRIQKILMEYETYFVDLSDLASVDDYAIYKTSVNQIDGKLYGIPFDSGVVGLFYRLDYIKEAGYSEEDMQKLTWEEYIEIGKQVKKKTGKYMITLNPNDLPMIRMILQSEGTWYTDNEGNINVSDNEVLKSSIEIYKKIVDAGIAMPISDWDQFIKAFQTGEVATVLSGSWISSSILEQSEQSGKWRVAEFPAISAESIGSASSVGGSGWYILAGVEQEELAKQFLAETFVSDLNLVNQLAERINLVSALKDVSECDNYQKGVEFYGGQKIFEDLYSWTSKIPSVNYGNATYEIEEYVTVAIQNVLEGESIDKALKDCENSYMQNER